VVFGFIMAASDVHGVRINYEQSLYVYSRRKIWSDMELCVLEHKQIQLPVLISLDIYIYTFC
jgi:hypothetical protein